MAMSAFLQALRCPTMQSRRSNSAVAVTSLDSVETGINQRCSLPGLPTLRRSRSRRLSSARPTSADSRSLPRSNAAWLYEDGVREAPVPRGNRGLSTTQVLPNVLAPMFQRHVEKRSTAETESADEDDMCVICFERPGGVQLRPCGHDLFCRVCARQVRKCPLCRASMTSWQDGRTLFIIKPEPPQREMRPRGREVVSRLQRGIRHSELPSI